MNMPIENLEDWLATTMPIENRNTLLDIGAYRGDFSTACFERNLCETIHLFEPNHSNHGHLETLAKSIANTHLHKIALGNSPGPCLFQCNSDNATGSLLTYQGNNDAELTTFQVEQQTLDQWWNSSGRPKVGLVKIDTQGNDLNVLLSGRDFLEQERPWLVIEFIHTPLYNGQSTPAKLLTWAESKSYTLGGYFNDHFTESGMLAFSDAVFIPHELIPIDQGRYLPRPSPQGLLKEVEQLQGVCAERLALIEYLHAEAKRRQDRIDDLTGQGNSPSATSS